MTDYCERSDVEARYGVVNITKWADMDNTGDATAITARIALAITNACGLIDDRLRVGRYVVPLSFSPIPRTIVQIAVIFAADDLYTSRGVADMDGEGNPVHRLRPERNDAEDMLDAILAGGIVLDRKASTDTPATALPEVVHCHGHHRHHRRSDGDSYVYRLRTDGPWEP